MFAAEAKVRMLKGEKIAPPVNLPEGKNKGDARDQAASVVGVSGKMVSRQIHFLHNNSNAIQCEQFKRLKIILAKYHILILQSRRTDLSLIKIIDIFNYLEFLEMKNANLLKPEEAAKLLGISRNTFSLMIAKNQLPAPAMIGNRKFWPKKELENGFPAVARNLLTTTNKLS